MKTNAKNALSLFIKGVLGGIVLSLGASSYLALNGSTFGAVLFAVSIFMLCAFSLPLCTGAICSFPQRKFSYVIDIAILALGNILTVYGIGKLLLVTRKGVDYQKMAATFCQNRATDSLISLFVLALLGGFAIYVAVCGFEKFFKKSQAVAIIACLAATILMLCRFEHFVLTAFYVTVARVWSLDMIGRLLIIFLGNAVGATLLPLLAMLSDKLGKKDDASTPDQA